MTSRFTDPAHPQSLQPAPPGLHAGYIQDVLYPRHVFRETMPVWTASVLTALGRRAPDLTQPYTWLELGCGQGLGVVMAAATNPLGQFLGVDINPQAIRQARALAETAGVANARFVCLDVEAPASEHALPACDFIVVHGLYSWVGDTQRAAIRRWATQLLKPGGVCHVGYLTQPGSASFAAAQRLMHLSSARTAGGSKHKVRHATAWLHQLAGAGLGYFQDVPDALANVPSQQELADDEAAAYHAHDLLNPHWDALHVSDVIASMAHAGCDYAGSASPLDNIDAASLPLQAQALLADLRRQGASVAEQETFKDLARNQHARFDLYQRHHPKGNLLPETAHRHALLQQRVGLLPEAPHVESPTGMLTLQSRIGPIQLPMSHVAPLLGALQRGPRSYAQLAQLPAYAQRPGELNSLLQLLQWANWLHPLRPDAGPQTSSEPAAHRLNAVLSDQPAPFNGAVLACAPIGSACAIPEGGLSPHHHARMAVKAP